ncbi:hypothetical protein V1478_009153 [Vespula squamosa]|uniref:Uncharacterized protein n=1 Tax=Vespula squamosa TaxID=30214 RepID=A0ABD2AQW7_VESSQ
MARFHVPPLRTSCDPVTKLGLREHRKFRRKFEFLTISRATSSHEMARFHVPPLRTSCDPVTKLGLREHRKLRRKLEFLTGDNNLPGDGTISRDNNLPGGGTISRATSSHLM